MAKDQPDFLRELESEAADLTSVPSEAGQARLRKMGQRMVELEEFIKDSEDKIKKANIELWDLKHKNMPDLMNEIGVDRLGLPDAGYDLELAPFYKANISAEWEPERRALAFQHLDDLGLGDIVKATITVFFGRGRDDDKREWLEKVRQLNFSFDPPELTEDRAVPWNTLTATVKEQFLRGRTGADPETGRPAMDLELLGASVGQEVKLKKRK